MPPNAYTRPDTSSTTALPKQVETCLDGTSLLAKTQALRISTVDAEGWPHASLLSAGDMLAMPGGVSASSPSPSRPRPPISNTMDALR
jgi:hypothetical protein